MFVPRQEVGLQEDVHAGHNERRSSEAAGLQRNQRRTHFSCCWNLPLTGQIRVRATCVLLKCWIYFISFEGFFVFTFYPTWAGAIGWMKKVLQQKLATVINSQIVRCLSQSLQMDPHVQERYKGTFHKTVINKLGFLIKQLDVVNV
jgi:hypothetical protein